MLDNCARPENLCSIANLVPTKMHGKQRRIRHFH